MFESIYNFFYRLFRVSGRTFIKHSFDPRPASHPYITGDGFRKVAKFIYDGQVKNVLPAEVDEGDIIFVGDSKIKEFLINVHPKIVNKYILITHNGDEQVDDEKLSLGRDKILKWYGINVVVKDDIVIPIPLGIENKHFFLHGVPLFFDMLRRKKNKKKNKIFYGFTVSTNTEERQVALDVMQNNKYSETVKKWMVFKKYLDLLVQCKFVVSPPGSSVEGHRTWDALYLNMVPIVKKSVTMDYFKSLGVPLWVVADWHELDSVNEEMLEAKFNEIRDDFDSPVLFMDYWINKIQNLKNLL